MFHLNPLLHISISLFPSRRELRELLEQVDALSSGLRDYRTACDLWSDWLAASETAVDALPSQFADRDAIQAAADEMHALLSDAEAHAAQLERLATLAAPLLQPRNSEPLFVKQVALLRERHTELKSRVEQQISRISGLSGTNAALDTQLQNSRDALLNAEGRVEKLTARVLAAVAADAVASDENTPAALKDEFQVPAAPLYF